MNLTRFVELRIRAGIKKGCLLAATAAIAWSLTGCTAAYNVRTDHSPDWRFATTCRIHGAMGRSYLADTKKKIVISIFAVAPGAKERSEREKKEALAQGGWTGPENPGAIVTATNALLFRKEYWLRGSNVQWSPLWGEQNSLSITVYDYGAGVEIPYFAQAAAPKRVLRTLNYQFDSGSGIYKEGTFK